MALATFPSTESPANDVLPAQLRGADLSGADLRGRDLSNRDLTDANLAEADLTGANLTGAVLANALLIRARLDDCELMKADLSGADLTECRAERACFGHARLDDAIMFSAHLPNARLTGASLRNADLRAAELPDARLRGADLTGADCTRALLRGCDMIEAVATRACFDDADLRRARVKRVTGYDQASWDGADIQDVDFTGAYIMRRFIADQNYLAEMRRRSRTHAILFHVWRVTSDCGRSFSRWALWTAAIAALFAALYPFVAIDYGEHATPLSPLYFSVVTLTTLGYGDVHPASMAGQLVVMAEVVVGYVMLGGLLAIVSNKMARRAD